MKSIARFPLSPPGTEGFQSTVSLLREGLLEFGIALLDFCITSKWRSWVMGIDGYCGNRNRIRRPSQVYRRLSEMDLLEPENGHEKRL